MFSITHTNSQLRHSPRHTRVSLRPLHLKISTTSWNTYHNTLSSFLASKGNRRTNTFFRFTYNVGTIFGAVGIVVAVAALLWTCASSAWMLVQKMSLAKGSAGTLDISHLTKRAMPDPKTSKTLPPSPYFGVTPIVSLAYLRPSHHPIIHRYRE